MVVFTCGHCGESVQKPKVEKHYLTKCRNKNPNLSCMDCFKDFLGNDYEAHIKCITEEERYAAKGFSAKIKKGERMQSKWVEMIQDVLDDQKDASSEVLRILEIISKQNNTPKKKPKFVNFVKNCCGSRTSITIIEQVWDIISAKLSVLSDTTQNDNKNDKEKTLKVNGEQNGKLADDKKEDGKETDDNREDVSDDDKVEQNGLDSKPEQKLSKKQKKEEKKRKKYEAELQSAEAPFEEKEVLEVPKKGKKNKNKGDKSPVEVETNGQEEVDKNKKRKRQDTVTTIPEVQENGFDENVAVKEKTVKKKLRKDSKLEPDECLHDQNVAKSENEVTENNGKFNWHEVIISLLQKKGNELPFKRLQKKVLGEYSEYTGCEVDDRIADKFIKKLRSAPNVRVDKNRVLLLVDE